MPWPALGAISAKNGAGTIQSVQTAAGDGSGGSPWVPLKADIGLGHPTDVAAGSDTGTETLISLFKRLLVRTITPVEPTDYRSPASSYNHFIKASTGVLYGLEAVNDSTNKLYLQLFNKASAPVNGDTPVRSYPMASGGSVLFIDALKWGNVGANQGLRFSTGIAWGWSTTQNTYTTPGTGATSLAVYGSYQ